MEKVRGTFKDGEHFELSLEDGKLYLRTEDSSYEFRLEEFLGFSWGINAYGEGAVDLNILKSSVIGKMLYPACLSISSWLGERTLFEVYSYRFRVEKGESRKRLLVLP